MSVIHVQVIKLHKIFKDICKRIHKNKTEQTGEELVIKILFDNLYNGSA